MFVFDKRSILKNILEPDEKLVFSKAFDQAYSCIKNYEPAFTEFLDPYKVSSIISFIGNNADFNICVFGGIEGCERQKIGFFPEFMIEEDFVFPISVVQINYNSSFERKLTHRDFLGALMGLGIARGKIGDILIEDNNIFVFADDNIVDFININLEKVGHTKVKTKIISCDEVRLKENLDELKNITLSSLRLDALLSGVFNMSRGKVSQLIKGEKAFINWNVCQNPSKQILEGDVITLRGFGRVKIVEFLGKTKKDRFLISIHKFI